MTIAELFLKLGIKVEGNVDEKLKDTKKGLGAVASEGLAAKAAIVAVVYGMERLMAASARAGTDLRTFGSLTGLSTIKLQQWQYAARQVGVSAEEISGSLKGVQSVMTDMLAGKGAPSGMGLLARAVGFDPAKARDTFYVMEKLQQFARQAPADLGNMVLKSFSVGEGVIAAMRQNAFRPDVFARAPLYSEAEQTQLQRVGAMWSNLFQKIEMAFGHLNAKHGGQLINDLSKITDKVIILTDKLLVLAEKFKVFDKIGTVFGVVAQSIDVINKAFDGASAKAGEDKKKGISTFSPSQMWKNMMEYRNTPHAPYSEDDFINPKPKTNDREPQSVQQTTINQELIFNHDGTNASEVSTSVKKAVNDALRQIATQGQGT